MPKNCRTCEEDCTAKMLAIAVADYPNERAIFEQLSDEGAVLLSRVVMLRVSDLVEKVALPAAIVAASRLTLRNVKGTRGAAEAEEVGQLLTDFLDNLPERVHESWLALADLFLEGVAAYQKRLKVAVEAANLKEGGKG